MRYKLLRVVLLISIMFLMPLNIQSYSEQDLWIMEVVLNQNLNRSVIVEALVLQDEIYLPFLTIGNFMEIPVDYERGGDIYSYLRPGDHASVVINPMKKIILINEDEWRSNFFIINGQVYLPIRAIGILTDATFTYRPTRLRVEIASEHLRKNQTENYDDMAENQTFKDQKEKFTVSKILFQWATDWHKNYQQLKIEGALPESYLEGLEDFDLIKDEYLHSYLKLSTQGTIYDWAYQLAGSVQVEEGELDISLDRVQLVYDMDQGTFFMGDGTLQIERELEVGTKGFFGVSITSHNSPLVRMNSNLIQLQGRSPQGSHVVLYVNKRKVQEQVVEDEGYFFRDVLLTLHDRVNEIKIEIRTPSGDYDEIYRYIAVSDGLLTKNEVSYLAQMGRKKDKNTFGDYLLNTIVYWGVREGTTLGVAWYGELASVDQKLSFDYTSLRFNQRLDDNWNLKSNIYHTTSNTDSGLSGDLGYKFSFDFKDEDTQAGLEYHKEASQFYRSSEPAEIIRVYYYQDITPNSLIEIQYSSYKYVEVEDSKKHHYVGYHFAKDYYEASLSFYNNIFNDHKWDNTFSSTLGYFIRPNIKIMQEASYQEKWDQVLTQKMDLGLNGSINIFDNLFFVGTNWGKEFKEDKIYMGYRASWNRNWSFTTDEYLKTSISYEEQFGAKRVRRIPINIGYYYQLPQDFQLKINYQGKWEETDLQKGYEHKLTVALEGAFNIYGGKLYTISPLIDYEKAGMVQGVVFKDTNRNGYLDSDEVAIEGIRVKLGNYLQYTDINGFFSFKQVPQGLYTLTFDYNYLPIELMPSIPDKMVRVLANSQVTENLGLYVVGALGGRVFVKDYIEPLSLTGIRILVNPGGYVAKTDRRGSYYFDQLPAGEYKVTLDTASLPDWALWEGIPHLIQISELGEYISGIDFNLGVNTEKLIQKPKEEIRVEIIPVIPTTPTIPPPSDTIIGLEDRLIEITEQVLKIDLKSTHSTFNGQEFTLKPFIIQREQIWAPIRAIAQLYGGRVFWDPNLKQIYIIDKEKNILFDIILGYVMINGVQQSDQVDILIDQEFSFILLDDLGILGLNVKRENDILYIYPQDK